jgi:hypothetical protein
MPRKEKAVSTRIFGEKGSNQILVGFLLVKLPTKGFNVLYFRSREVTPVECANCAQRTRIIAG